MVPTNLDIDVLRSFVAGIDLKGYGKAAAFLGRSPSAISLQLRKLEGQIGRPLFLKQGRGLALTETGEALLSHARRILDLNDATLAALRDEPLTGEVRIGLPQDVAEMHFSEVLARFGRLYPNVRVQARVDRHAALRSAFEAGELDVALVWDAEEESHDPLVSAAPMTWIGQRGGPIAHRDQPLPLVLFEAPCIFRRAALDALDRAGITWRISFISPSLSGLWAAVSAGLGITVRLAHGLPSTLAPVEAVRGLPTLPRLSLSLLCTSQRDDQTIARLATTLRETFADRVMA